MTGAAGSDDLRVVNGHHRCKNVRRMAVLTDIRRTNMSHILAGRLGSIVAADTIPCDIEVIEVCGQPADRAVTVIAGIGTGDMRWVLARRDDAVVTGAAHSDDLGVIHGHHWREDVSRVAIFTYVRCLDMCGAFSGCINAVMAADAVPGDIHMIEIRG